ncbi:hypothetical protein GGS26DRAFT_303885 [Hypomontagnella submonticulosa]|nr:hypothetical protein GGS26DRAFT_303885 [Hypomontagnella submonticulosa]
MDRNLSNSQGVLAARPDGIINGNGNSNGRGTRNSTQPFGNRRVPTNNNAKPESKDNFVSDIDAKILASPRQRLYSSPTHIPKSNSLGASTQRSSESPRETRIPRPKSSASFNTSPIEQNSPQSVGSPRNNRERFQKQDSDMRQPLNLKSAFALAKKQETDDQLDDTFTIRRAFNMASAEMNRPIDGSPSPAPRYSQRRQSYSAIPQRTLSGGSNNDLGNHLKQFDQRNKLGGSNRPLNGLFGKNRVSPKVSETANAFSKKVSDGNLQGSPTRRRDSQPESNPRHSRHAGALVPIPSIEYESASDDRASPTNKPVHLSPEKSYNWHLDADFTAGDLQVSDSPRIRTTQSNGESPRRLSNPTNSPFNGIQNQRRGNNRIEQIRQKEVEAANVVLPEEDVSSSGRRTSRLDELRAREMEALSRRAVATSRLDEIRIRNSEARSESPENGRNSNKGDLRGSSLQIENEPTMVPENKVESKIDSNFKVEGKQVLDNPITVARGTSEEQLDEVSKKEGGDTAAESDKNPTPLLRNDSQDLLRRLAQATSASPPAEKSDQYVVSDDPPIKERPEGREDSGTRLTREERRPRNLEVKSLEVKSLEGKNLEVKGSRERPTVGFAGLRRMISSDSIREKRSSLPGSEDPTDRIEAEMKLFAPLDNYSEKGSVRAPSPVPSEPIEEETPRPTKIDPLTQPTPRVTGAYVETPATVKVKQEAFSDDKKAMDDPNQTPVINSELHNRSSSEPSHETSREEKEGGVPKSPRRPRSSSVPTASRRTRSTSRRRRPLRPLINTAKPPSVKDDIRAILRMNEIDDSTLDDFDSILADQEIDDEELQQMVNDTMNQVDNDLETPGLSDRDLELQIYDRMSKSLRSGLLGIRSAKKGIERLEDKVTHAEHKADQVPTDLNDTGPKVEETHAPIKAIDSASTIISIPTLYRKSPKPRLTKFGLLALAAFIWYVLESTFCFLYTPQYDCTPALPCVWSPNEPYFPYAMPFMLDEWATGGKGRALAWRMNEEIGDVFADVSNWITKTDLTQLDERFMDVWERKRHRRRLEKRGLIPKWVAPSDYRPRFAGWNTARLAMEEDGYEAEDETMGADEIVR